MRLPDTFLAELRYRVPMRELVCRSVPLKRSGSSSYVGLCPFHTEKTPSFHVYDDHYHCFSCGEHGDAITFLMQTQNLDFLPAVEKLAAEVGLDMPSQTPAAVAQQDSRQRLLDVLQAASMLWQRMLWEPAGAAGLSYLRGRGLADETIRAWKLGWVGHGGNLDRALGVSREVLVDAGLASQNGSMFFERVMFPIDDQRGRTISFTGRRLAGEPKYLNGPETVVFSKRRTLYGVEFAAVAARRGASVQLVEGTIDTIQAHQAGMDGTVGSLGTAITDDQMAMLWKLSPSPILCLDGDKPGRMATKRTIQLALPKLTIERTLLVARMPGGTDPDGLIAAEGIDAWRTVLSEARAFGDALYEAVAPEQDPGLEPHANAMWRARLEAAADAMLDKKLAGAYKRSLMNRFFSARRAVVGNTDVEMPDHDCIVTYERARELTAILLRHPGLLEEVAERYVELELPAPWASMRDAIQATCTNEMTPSELASGLASVGLSPFVKMALSDDPAPLPDFAGADASEAQARSGWLATYAMMSSGTLEDQVRQMQQAFEANPNEATQRLLIALTVKMSQLQIGIVS